MAFIGYTLAATFNKFGLSAVEEQNKQMKDIKEVVDVLTELHASDWEDLFKRLSEMDRREFSTVEAIISAEVHDAAQRGNKRRLTRSTKTSTTSGQRNEGVFAV